MSTSQEKSHRFPCPGCGAILVFEPGTTNLTCPYCGRSEAIPQSIEQVEERSYEEYLNPRTGQMGEMAQNAIEVQCNSCGATVTFTPPEVAGECSFCGAHIVAQPKSADPLVAPEAVLPFKVTSQQAADGIKKWTATRWFAPNALKKMAYHEGVGGVYLPFWTYDANTTSPYQGQRGEYYYVEETYTETDSQGNQVTRTRQVRHTRWYSASGVVARWFDDVLIPATKAVPLPRLGALEPWDLSQLTAYDPAFLSGYKAQRYQVDLPQGFEQAKSIMARQIEQDIRRDIGGYEQRIDRYSTSYTAITFKHILLPVYLGAYRFKGKVYQVMLNAQTGEIQGERPYSVWKITLFILLMLAIIGIIIYFSR